MAPLNVAFNRSLVGVNLQSWHDVVAIVANVRLTNQRDPFVWGLHRALLIAEALPYNTLIWKLKLPLKIKVFM